MATVLVVDDDPVIRRLLIQVLQRADHAVMTAEHGGEGLQRLEEALVDLVVVDLSMPEMDGMEMLRRVRSTNKFQNLPVIMLTASGQERDAETAKEVGVNEFLTKPFSSRELRDAVSRLLARPSHPA